MGATYKSGTVTFIQEVRKNSKIGDMKMFEKDEIATEALQVTTLDGSELSAKDKQLLAKMAGKDSSIISHYVNNNSPHQASRDIILCANLMRETVPNADEVSHTLLMMRRSELYPATCDKSVNCRNLILRLCLDYAANPANRCPTENWVRFTNTVIIWFHTQIGLDLDVQLKPISLGEPDFGFIKTHKALLADWELKLRQVGRCDMSVYRQALLKAYMVNQGITKKEHAYAKLAMDAKCSEEVVRPIFARRTRRPGSRDSLIRVAVAMGCSLNEINLLLRQVPLAAVYPRRINEEMDEELLCQALKQEGILPQAVYSQFLEEGFHYETE